MHNKYLYLLETQQMVVLEVVTPEWKISIFATKLALQVINK